MTQCKVNKILRGRRLKLGPCKKYEHMSGDQIGWCAELYTLEEPVSYIILFRKTKQKVFQTALNYSRENVVCSERSRRARRRGNDG